MTDREQRKKRRSVKCPDCGTEVISPKNFPGRVIKCNFCGYKYEDPKKNKNKQGVFSVARNL